jgi:hypothetical protein
MYLSDVAYAQPGPFRPPFSAQFRSFLLTLRDLGLLKKGGLFRAGGSEATIASGDAPMPGAAEKGGKFPRK